MMKVLFVSLLLIAVMISAACNVLRANLPVPPPGFVSWCDTCRQYTDWYVLEDYFKCSASETVWNPMED